MMSDVHPDPQIKCDICEEEGADICCTTCASEGVPYHQACWLKQSLHRPTRTPSHRQTLIRDIERIRYLNKPNTYTSVDDTTLEEDGENCFVEFDVRSHKFQFGRRAFPLLRKEQGQHDVQYPSFVSFVGRTMNGKSFLLRTLQLGGPPNMLPSPIPAPGAQEHNYKSTSSDINLYADWKTVDSQSPILFLDCEGFEGSELPTTLAAKTKKTANQAAVRIGLRREYVENAYPRFVYAFSTCVVFVTSGPLAESTKIGERLLSYASQGAGGSQNQGFKPSLFVIFNRFQGGNAQDFDWSITSSTAAFLAHENLRKLELYYSAIHVVYIPSTTQSRCDVALAQLDAFHALLREEHERAFSRRRDFRLIFPSSTLAHFLWRALELFSKSRDSVFDWSVETALSFRSNEISPRFQDLWTQCARHYSTPNNLTHEIYPLTRSTFEQHILFCVLLSLTRKPPYGERVGVIPHYLANLVRQVEQLVLDYAPCGAVSGGIKCGETRIRHGDHHQGLMASIAVRWPGTYQEYEGAESQTFQSALTSRLQGDEVPNVSLRALAPTTLPPDICSVASCFGCLMTQPGTILACKHAFCLDCVHDLAQKPELPHRLGKIWCPFHNSLQLFSPRLLPAQSGYRILSLDGGGVKGFAQLVILREIEKRCFNIPTAQLYDLIVGTSVGGQIALALTTPTRLHPLTALVAAEELTKIMKVAFVRKHSVVYRMTGIPWLLGKTKYKAKLIEDELRNLFGNDERLYRVGSSQSSSLPHIAVTTVTQDPFKARLLANYNRKANPEACSLMLDPDPDKCMPIWAAARCTSAAFPYFKAFQWQGQMFLDGGFQLNCPAAAAFSEAECIWPESQCDILTSLGTGKHTTYRPLSLQNTSEVLKSIVDAATSSEEIWSKFAVKFASDHPEEHRIFRLNPLYAGTGLELDDVQKLGEIEKETEAWLTTCEQMTPVCDQLIASLFFFLPKPIENGVQKGSIFCRLPVDLDARQGLVAAMRQEHNLNLFMVEFVDRNRDPIYVDAADNITSCGYGHELCIQVELRDLPETGEIKVQIKMRNLGQNAGLEPQSHKWTAISGSPYVLRKESL